MKPWCWLAKTALATTVPAAMSHYAGINLRSTPKLLGAAGNDYTRYMTHKTWGKGKTLNADRQWLFDEITTRGWDADLMNQEAMNVLQGMLGRNQGSASLSRLHDHHHL